MTDIRFQTIEANGLLSVVNGGFENLSLQMFVVHLMLPDVHSSTVRLQRVSRIPKLATVNQQLSLKTLQPPDSPTQN